MFNFLKKGTDKAAKAVKNTARETTNGSQDNISDMLNSLNDDMMERNKRLAEQIAKNQLGQ